MDIDFKDGSPYLNGVLMTYDQMSMLLRAYSTNAPH
jgi:hypothetical protein